MKLRIAFFLCFLSLVSSGQSLKQRIETAYTAFEKDPQLKYAISSLTVLHSQTGEVLFSRNGNIGLAPASTLKTVTSATAYYLLGSDFAWKTNIGYTGRVNTGGVLNGDLIITGGGDPTLGSWRYNKTQTKVIFDNWIDAIRKAGIKEIKGNIIADDSLFGTQTTPVGWTWQDMGNYYGAGPNSLTWRENQVDITFQPGNNVGDATKLIRTVPDLSYLKIVNEVKTGKAGSGDNVYIYSAPYSDLIYLRGTYGIDLKKPISGSIPDPAFEVAFRLQDTLNRIGIKTGLAATTTRKMSFSTPLTSFNTTPIATITSPALEQVVYWFNQKSVNLYGEHLLKTLAWKFGKEASTPEGVSVVQNFWKDKLSIDPDEINISDGSGLSPGNRITTSAMARILQYVKKEPWFKSYFESFPLYNDMKMKSGTISDVLGYTGYQTTSSGVPVTFSFIINNYNGSASSARQKMFNVLNTLK
ncbi:MAG TPA: D-alanyl-D-alanine carboxypeptidase/D-alanyl-D-alanine-endopeptidase [Sphingobacteriaceae bacterium]|nr:D-alanyl-D-alanine carboxypeptidase/D-alanyl-D-alanine-endopeptidase [Sphingobacteriaceae bacterium]